jgi:hypothetical protein
LQQQPLRACSKSGILALQTPKFYLTGSTRARKPGFLRSFDRKNPQFEQALRTAVLQGEKPQGLCKTNRVCNKLYILKIISSGIFPMMAAAQSLFKIWNFGVANAKILPCRLQKSPKIGIFAVY